MESFPVQSPEISTDDDDDESLESSRDRKDDREYSKEEVERKEDKAEPEAVEEKEIAKPENQEGEIPLESLADDELRLVAQQYIDERAEALKSELINVPENSPDEAAALANATMLEAIEAKLSQGEKPGEQTVEDAVSETAQDLEIEVPETENQAPTDEKSDDQAPETPPEAQDETDQPDPADPAQVVAAAPGTNQVSPTTNSNPNIPAIPGPGPGPAPGTPGGPGGGNNLPPIAPLRGYGGVPPINPNYNVNNQNVAPNPPTPNVPNAPENIIVKHNAAAPYLLLGYLIGRRRGRIKTEEKLLPVQKKLEKEVSDLHKNIAAGEEKIRKLAREKAEATPGTAAKIAERLEERKKSRDEKPEIYEKPEPEKEIKIKPEKLGMLAVTKETPPEKPAPVPVIEKRPKTPEPLKVPERPKDPINMNVPELLVIAAHIPTEHSNVKKLYEKHILTEQGLREVTQAYLKGERYETIVHKNLVSAESPSQKNYETEPSVISSHETSPASGKSHDAKTRTDPWAANDYSAQRPGSTKSGASSQQPVRNSQTAKSLPKAATSALITATVLAAIVLLLFMLRR